MNTRYTKRFLKDLKNLQSTSVYAQIRSLVIDEIPNLINLDDINHLKKLKGKDEAYRIRVGDYRIGFMYDGEAIIFKRVLHRSEVYRYFP